MQIGSHAAARCQFRVEELGLGLRVRGGFRNVIRARWGMIVLDGKLAFRDT
jgi:hypothetical protein